jgi:hypothetical protein
MSAPYTRRIPRGPVAALAILVVCLVAWPTPAGAQSAIPVTALSFDRPEAWALKYFASSTLLAGLEPPRKRLPWSVSFGAELEWIPPVSAGNRYVGLEGTKQEDLNKTPIYFRPRFIIGLPHDFSLIVAFDPPIRAFGIKPKLLALAVERPIYESEPWSVGLRVYGQGGSVTGAYTCPASVLAYPPGSPGNIYGCDAESTDVATLRYLGSEISVAHQGFGHWKLSPHLSIGVNYMNLAMATAAPTFGTIDAMQYTTHGFTVSGDIGVSYRFSDRLGLSLDSLYTPLWITRPTTGRYMVPFYNLRALFTYKIR